MTLFQSIVSLYIQRLTSSKLGFTLLFFLVIFCIRAQDSVILTEEEKLYQQRFLEILDSHLADTLKLKYIMDSVSNVSIYSTELPFEMLRKGLSLARKIEQKTWLHEIEQDLGLLYADIGRRDSAKFYLKSALLGYEKLHNLRKQAEVHGHMGSIHAFSDNFELSLKHCYAAMDIFEQLDDQEGIGLTYNDFARTYYNAENYEEALKNALVALEVFQDRSNYSALLVANELVSSSYFAIDDLPKARKYIDAAIQIIENEDHDVAIEDISPFYLARGKLKIENEEYDSAMEDYLLARNTFKDGIKTLASSFVDYYIARLNATLGNYRVAIDQYKEVVAFERSVENKGLVKYVLGHISTAYQEINQFDSAYYYLLEARELSTDQMGYETAQKMEELKAIYEAEKKDERIAIQEQALKQKSIIQWLSLGGLLTVFLFLMQAVRNFRKQKKGRIKLEKLNKDLEDKNRDNELLLKEIHHRVKNNLQTVSSLLSLQSESISDQAAFDAVLESKNRVASMALIHQKLYQGENLAAIEMKDYFHTISEAVKNSFGKKAEKVNLEIEMDEIELDVDTAIPIGLITNELLTNSLKYAFPNQEPGTIKISMHKAVDDLITLQISDNGNGVDAAPSSLASSGFGTMLVQLLSTQLGAELLKSTTNGTAVMLKFTEQEKSVA